MALQTKKLIMLTLGVINSSSYKKQLKLQDGVHLRWSFAKKQGFPWYGYYLFRRKHYLPDKTKSISKTKVKYENSSIVNFSELKAGLIQSYYLDTDDGIFISDNYLKLLDLFSPKNLVEIDLEKRSIVRFYFKQKPAVKIKCLLGFKKSTKINIKLQLWNQTFYEKNLWGQKHSKVAFVYVADCITSIEFTGAAAVLVDLSYILVDKAVLNGWQPVKGFQYPYCLPVSHKNYPCIAKPENYLKAKELARQRIKYGDFADWEEGFKDLYKQLKLLVKDGPAGTAMADKSLSYKEAASISGKELKLSSLKIMDLLLLGSLHPAIAQMLGLYYLDTTAGLRTAYDYLIVEDLCGVIEKYKGKVLKTPDLLLVSPSIDLLNSDLINAWVCFKVKLSQVKPLPPPEDLKVYALPGITVRDEKTGLIKNSGMINNAGLRWKLTGNDENLLFGQKHVMYQLWRADLEQAEPKAAPAIDKYKLITKNPFVISSTMAEGGNNLETSSQYPPFSLYAYDNHLKDGWYSYRLTGIDIFGQDSGYSKPATWHQWQPVPQPKPWYYQDAGNNTEIHKYAVNLVDKTPPPPPVGIEAFALDPQDPSIVKDKTYNSWFKSISTTEWYAGLSEKEQQDLIALRVRWQWTLNHMQQAPGVQAFGIYYQPGSQPPTDHHNHANWAKKLFEVAYNSSYIDKIQVLTDADGNPVDGYIEKINNKDIHLAIDGTEIDLIKANIHYIKLLEIGGQKSEIIKITAVDSKEKKVILENSPQGKTYKLYQIGTLYRYYEVFFPDAIGNPQAGLPDFKTTANYPSRYAHIGVNAIADKNPPLRGIIGAPVKIFSVLRDKPGQPVMTPPDSEKVYASAPDYQGLSYYTFRWQPANHMKTHIYRALDESIYNLDYENRKNNQPESEFVLDPENNPAHSAYFPNEQTEPLWDSQKRQTIADEINNLNQVVTESATKNKALLHYHKLSNDTMRVLSGLPGMDQAFMQLTGQPLDPDDPQNHNKIGPDNHDDYIVDNSLRIFIDSLAGNSRNRFVYRYAYVDKVNNIGSMSLSSVPVYVPKTFLPDRPVIIETHIQNLAFTIKWIVNNARADLSNCVIYKSDDMENTRDIRLMQNVCSMSIEAVSAVVELTWTDTDVEADKKYYYRIVAVDIYNNISLPADLVEAFIIDTDLPEPPVFKHAAWILLDKADKTQTAWPNDNNIPAGKQAAIKLVFSAQKAGQQLFLMKKSRKTSFWQTIAQKNNFLLINKFDLQFIDTEVKPDTNYKYKIKVISAAGIPCLEYKLIELSRPLKDKKWITS